MTSELYFCQNCEDHNRNPIVRLNRSLRCDACGSDAVISVERLLLLQRQSQENRNVLFLPDRRM
ncbi:MAG TPA: hypothetical protein VI703_06860 [Anaerolineales bacterium]|nr:hypothetical protein [Anaerolineales bacterium]